MQKENKRHALVITSVLVLTLIIVVRASFAFFSASINGNIQDISVQAAKLGSLEYTAIDNLNLGDAVMPGASSEADFTVTYVGSGVDLTYDLELTVSADTFNNIDTVRQLILTLDGSTNGSNIPIGSESDISGIENLKNATAVTTGVSPTINATSGNKLVLDLTDGITIKPSDDNKTYKIIKTVRISEGEVHTYKVNLAFINYEKVDQNNNQNKVFNARLGISNQQIYVPGPPVRLIDGCSDVGCEVAIGSEHFNIFSTNKNETLLLSKYNLNVGDYLIPNATEGIQHERARGGYADPECLNTHADDDQVCYDEYFSGGGYFSGIVFDENWESEYENSTIKAYVDNYIEYLNIETGHDDITARLVSKEEMQSAFHESGSVKENYNWILNTSFWSSTASDEGGEVWCFDQTANEIHLDNVGRVIDIPLYFGVRPLIIIPSSLME